MSPPEVRVRGLVAGYRAGAAALRGVDLHVRPGTVTAVVGCNGAGKTTLFRSILGFLRPLAGGIVVAGRSPSQFRRAHGIGYLPEIVGLPAGWTVGELLSEGARLSGIPARERRDAVAAALEHEGLTCRARLDRLSRGTARRVAFAWALLGDPPLVILDEPWSGLDPPARLRLRETIRHLAARGRTVVVASHELDEVARVADDAVALRHGSVAGRLSPVEPAALARIFEGKATA